MIRLQRCDGVPDVGESRILYEELIFRQDRGNFATQFRMCPGHKFLLPIIGIMFLIASACGFC